MMIEGFVGLLIGLAVGLLITIFLLGLALALCVGVMVPTLTFYGLYRLVSWWRNRG